MHRVIELAIRPQEWLALKGPVTTPTTPSNGLSMMGTTTVMKNQQAYARLDHNPRGTSCRCLRRVVPFRTKLTRELLAADHDRTSNICIMIVRLGVCAYNVACLASDRFLDQSIFLTEKGNEPRGGGIVKHFRSWLQEPVNNIDKKTFCSLCPFLFSYFIFLNQLLKSMSYGGYSRYVDGGGPVW